MKANELAFGVVKEGSLKRMLSTHLKKYYYKTKAALNGLEPKGVIKKYYRNNKLAAIKHFDNLNRLTREITYYENGKLDSEKSFKNGRLDGICRLYHWNGNLRAEISYKEGKLHGTYTIYDEKENIKVTEHFEEGKRIKRVYKAYLK